MRRSLLWSVVLGLSAACSLSPRPLTLRAGDEYPFARLGDELASADVVVLGEEHDSARVHAAHHELLHDLFARRRDLVISMEMFERDVQAALTQYLRGDIDEDEFLARARPWPNYKTDYKPVIEFARANKLEVIAANVPRELASKVSKQGIEVVANSPHAAKATTAPEDDYWTAFQNTMREESHGMVMDDAALKRFYTAQCLKDDTMAESIATRIAEIRKEGRKPLVVHFCGKFHSDSRLGTVARLQQRMPDLAIKVLSVVSVKPKLADYVLVVPETEDTSKPMPKPKADPHKVAADPHKITAGDKPVDPHKPADPHQVVDPHQQPAGNAGGGSDAAPTGRPALGLRPDYQFTGEGLRVEAVNEGGAAEAGGVKEGDVIVKVAGEPIESVQGYMEVLSNLTPGKEVEVAVKRDGKDVKLKVKVGTRAQ